MSHALPPLEQMLIEREILQLVHAYSRALDLGDMDAAADCFAVDGSMARPMMPDTVIQGREAIRASLRTRPKTLLTKHLATNTQIEVLDADHAQGLSYLTMISCTPGAGDTPPFVSAGPLWFGEFRDRYVREDGRWRILERRGSIQMKFNGGQQP